MTKLNNYKLLDSYTEEDVINANKKIYTKNAETYEDVVFTKNANQRLRTLLSNAVRILSTKKRNIVALDACGGTGQASFILYDMGCTTHLVDLSSKMIKNMNIKCQQGKIEIQSFTSEINEFFQNNKIKYDLIVFSSSLHHLRYPDKVLNSAANNLSKGGIVATISDPTTNIQKLSFKTLSLFDRAINHILNSPKIFFEIMIRKLSRKNLSKETKEIIPDWLAEFHTVYGIDDFLLANSQISNGNYILMHKRFTAGYTKLFQIIYKLLKLNTSFSLLISNESYSDINTEIDLK